MTDEVENHQVSTSTSVLKQIEAKILDFFEVNCWIVPRIYTHTLEYNQLRSTEKNVRFLFIILYLEYHFIMLTV